MGTGFGPPFTSPAMCLRENEQDGPFIVAARFLRPLAAFVRFAAFAVHQRSFYLFIYGRRTA
jgi:hypothetical protein